jgi:FkbM family methyltransferase
MNSEMFELLYSKLWNNTYLWPKNETNSWKIINKKKDKIILDEMLSYVDNKDLVIQAGGNGGIYPEYLGRFFKKVITFEPDPINFHCLSYNTLQKNIFKFQACLGNNFQSLSVEENKDFLGMSSLTVTDQGMIPQFTIDCFNLNPSLIFLDIEGYEGFAIEGAIETIKRCKPIIILEVHWVSIKQGWDKEKINKLMFSLGYKILKEFEKDIIYAPE